MIFLKKIINFICSDRSEEIRRFSIFKCTGIAIDQSEKHFSQLLAKNTSIWKSLLLSFSSNPQPHHRSRTFRWTASPVSRWIRREYQFYTQHYTGSTIIHVIVWATKILRVYWRPYMVIESSVVTFSCF